MEIENAWRAFSKQFFYVRNLVAQNSLISEFRAIYSRTFFFSINPVVMPFLNRFIGGAGIMLYFVVLQKCDNTAVSSTGFFAKKFDFLLTQTTSPAFAAEEVAL